jgi:hypothetical protein
MLVGVKPQRRRVAVTQAQGGGGLRAGIEPHHLGQLDRPHLALDVGEHPARRDGRQLAGVGDHEFEQRPLGRRYCGVRAVQQF